MDESQSVTNLCGASDGDKPCVTPVGQGRLCDRHEGELFAALSRVPVLEAELAVTIARQDRLQAASEGGKSAVLPLAFSWSGAEAGWALTNTLTSWASTLAVALGLPLDEHGHPAALRFERVADGPRHARSHVVAVPQRIIQRTTTRTVTHTDPETGAEVTEQITEKFSEIIPARYHDDPAAIVPPPELAARAATWLARHLRHLVALGDAGQLVDEITHVVGRTRHVIDRAPARWYVGGCDRCGTAMYGRPGVAVIVCPNRACVDVLEPAECSVHEEPGEWCDSRCHITEAIVARTRYDVAARREWMLAAAEDYLATAPEAITAVKLLAEVDLNVNTLRQAGRYREDRNRAPEITVDHTHPDGRARYRIGDVLDLARRIALRRAE
jgi:hypothetical protein